MPGQVFAHLTDIFEAWKTDLSARCAALGTPLTPALLLGHKSVDFQGAPPQITFLSYRAQWKAGAHMNIGRTTDGSNLPSTPPAGRTLATRTQIIECHIWSAPSSTDTDDSLDGYDQAEDLLNVVTQTLDKCVRGSWRPIGDTWDAAGVGALGIETVFAFELDRPVVAAPDTIATIATIKAKGALVNPDGSTYSTPQVTIPIP